jgi:16S rRNA (adenine1518-N6/adenine1519-N6)-dimethyltransferase
VLDEQHRQPREESLLSETRRLLRRAGLRARKGLGQHFLIDRKVLHRIISAAQLSQDDIVLEVGPGLGVLTRELAKRAGRVVAIELDSKLVALLEETLADFGNTTVINEDVLKIDAGVLLREQKAKPPSELAPDLSYKVVANLPYYIASAVLRHFLEASVKPQSMVVMMQKEVAEEIVAAPGRMSLLSISVQLYGQPKIVDYVPARSFYPAPEVDSAILKIAVYPRPALDVDIESFFTLVRAGFSASRKQLANSLAQGLRCPKAEALSLLGKAGISPQRRAETLSLDEWGELWQAYSVRSCDADH